MSKIKKVDNAIILSAGMASRMRPLSLSIPKGLIAVRGEVLIERTIRQLKEKNINNIIVVVGYLSEKFGYLKEKYGVTLILNKEYEKKNVWYSLYLAREYLKNSYICSADYYYIDNPFNSEEEHAFYSTVKPNTKGAIRGVTSDSKGRIIDTSVPAKDGQWLMFGHAFFDCELSQKFCKYLEQNCLHTEKYGYYWEQIVQEHIEDIVLFEKRIDETRLVELDSIAELEDFDANWREENQWIK